MKNRPKRSQMPITYYKKRHEIAERRLRVSELYGKGFHNSDISRELGVSESTVDQDIRFLIKEWRKISIDNIDQVKSHDLIMLDVKMRECHDRLTRCTNPTQGARWMEEWRHLLEHKGKMLGYFPDPKIRLQHEVNIVTKEQRDAAFAAALVSNQSQIEYHKMETIDISPEQMEPINSSIEAIAKDDGMEDDS